MKENGISELRHTKEFNVEGSRPNGIILVIGKEDSNVIYDIYRVYTNNGNPDDDQEILVIMMQHGDNLFDYYYNKCTEVMYANI